MIELSSDQLQALLEIKRRVQQGDGLVTLGGYAGTGKSTLIPFIAQELGDLQYTAFACYTGKAANVLKSKLKDAGLLEAAAFVGTIHSLIYQPRLDEHGDVSGWEKKPRLVIKVGEGGWGNEIPVTRIIIDEVSMVNAETLADLQHYGVPIVAVGDPAQLPPVQGESVIEKPDVLLSKIHRQAEGNPIIQLAQYIREFGDFPKFQDSENIRRMSFAEASPAIRASVEELGLDTGVVFRTNAARVFGNQAFYGDVPAAGNLVMCLKNEHTLGIANGMRGVIEEIRPVGAHHYNARICFPEDGNFARTYRANKHQFGREKTLSFMDAKELKMGRDIGQLFDFGVAMTCHKAQGSSFRHTYLSPKKFGGRDESWRRWLYTAVTRSSEKLFVLPSVDL